MSVVSTWLPANWLLQSQSANLRHSFRFCGAQQLLSRNAPPPSLTLTRCSTHPLRIAELSMAEPDSSFDTRDYAEIVVVRHGETEWNVDGRIQGHLDVELNDAGREQAAAVADRLSKEPKISVIYTSDLKRALETAETIAGRCGGVEVIKDPDLRERHLGDLQGIVFRDAAKICPDAHEAFISPKKDQEIPNKGSENWPDCCPLNLVALMLRSAKLFSS